MKPTKYISQGETDANNKKILVLTSSFPRYGGDFVGNSVYELAKELTKKNVEVCVIAPLDKKSKRYEIMDNIKVHRFQYFIPINWQKVAYQYGIPENLRRSLFAKLQLSLFLLFFFLKALKNSKKDDIIHAQWILCGLIAVLIKKLIKKPVVLTVRGSGLRMMSKSISKFVLNNTDVVISPHPELTQIVRSLGRNDVIEIPNIVDDDKFNLNIDSSNFEKEFSIGNEYIISFIARLNEFKDPITFIKAIPYVLEKNKNVRFFVVGDGILKNKINELIKKLDIREFVTVTGSRNDVNVLLRASTIFTALSPIENIWSRTIVEAMKCGVPCIVTKSGMTGKCLSDKVNAYLVPPKDEKQLANAILYLIGHEELREKLAKNGITLMEKRNVFSKEYIIKRTVEVYEHVVNKRNRSWESQRVN